MCDKCAELREQVQQLSNLLMESGAHEVELFFGTDARFLMDGKDYSVVAGDTVKVRVNAWTL